MVRPRTLVLNELHWAAERLIWGSRRLQFGFRLKYRSSGLAGLPGPQDVLLPAKKKRGSREQPSPPCQRVTNRLRFRHVGPIERLSRRSQEHRPTIGALEPPQVTPMCLLGGKPLAQRRPSIEQRVIPTGERAKALLPTRDRRENGEPNFNRCRVCTTEFWSGIFWVVAARAHHTRSDAARVFFINPVNGCGRHAAPLWIVCRMPDQPGDRET